MSGDKMKLLSRNTMCGLGKFAVQLGKLGWGREERTWAAMCSVSVIRLSASASPPPHPSNVFVQTEFVVQLKLYLVKFLFHLDRHMHTSRL